VFSSPTFGSAAFGANGLKPPPNATIVGAIGPLILIGQLPVIFRGIIALPAAGVVSMGGAPGTISASSNVTASPMAMLILTGDVGGVLTAAIVAGITAPLLLLGGSPTIFSSNFVSGALGAMSLTPKTGTSAAGSTSVQPNGMLKMKGQLSVALLFNRRRQISLIRTIRSI
jgi:hypothetical protein